MMIISEAATFLALFFVTPYVLGAVLAPFVLIYFIVQTQLMRRGWIRMDQGYVDYLARVERDGGSA